MSVLLIAPQDQQAWLVGPDHEAARDGVPLCASHADRVTVPFGWSLRDDRPTTKPRTRRKSRARKARAETISDHEEPVVPAVPDAEAPTTESAVSEPPDGEAPEGELAVSEPAGVAPGTESLPRARHHSPAEVPLHADDVAAALTGSSARLSVVPGDDDPSKTFAVEVGGQTALWAESHRDDHEPSDQTPLLKRAFRVVRED